MVSRVYHLDRGYEHVEEKLGACGARIERIKACMTDARFEDGGERPLNLGAQDADDLGVISALVQDAVFPITEMSFRRGKRQFALLLNRFRWEDRDAAERAGAAMNVCAAFWC